MKKMEKPDKKDIPAKVYAIQKYLDGRWISDATRMHQDGLYLDKTSAKKAIRRSMSDGYKCRLVTIDVDNTSVEKMDTENLLKRKYARYYKSEVRLIERLNYGLDNENWLIKVIPIKKLNTLDNLRVKEIIKECQDKHIDFVVLFKDKKQAVQLSTADMSKVLLLGMSAYDFEFIDGAYYDIFKKQDYLELNQVFGNPMFAYKVPLSSTPIEVSDGFVRANEKNFVAKANL